MNRLLPAALVLGCACFGAPAQPREHVQAPLPSREEIAKLPPDGGEEFNRLIFESSPYLLQHARNPVDWYPWGEAAFAKARKDDKPIFLSVGYSTCHWCHVMERESFENADVAALMNARFVCVKVDREERPDVDAIYMAAVQAMTGSGGWPMSVFLAPDRRPFWGGTYFPPDDRFGRPGFRSLLGQIADAWAHKREDLLQGASRLTEHIRAQAKGGQAAELTAATLQKGYAQYADQFDADHGGFGGAPKFPRGHALSFLLRQHRRAGEAQALQMVEATLDHIARGGIRDHLGGGFHRYATDRIWLVPHFEKMLYDQAILARAYLEAYQVTDKTIYAHVARDIFRYILRDMTDSGGGFYSAEDADSEGLEGKFYTWTTGEILSLLGEEDGKFFCQVYGVEPGQEILHLKRPSDEGERLSPLREKLFAARERRIRPHKDDKILADWNGLMIGALAYGARALDEPHYLEAARRAADFVLGRMQKDGRLLHRYRQGQAGISAFLDDYAFVIHGLLELYEVSFELRWLAEASRLAQDMLRQFWDSKDGGFHLSGRDGEPLIAATKELYDGAVPSGNSVATLALLRLGRLTADGELEERGRANLQRFSAELARHPMGYPHMLMALDFALGPTQEVVLAGEARAEDMAVLRRTLYARFLPRLVLAHRPVDAQAAAAAIALVPYIKDQIAQGGQATAYVCENYACSLPTTDPQRVLVLVAGSPRDK